MSSLPSCLRAVTGVPAHLYVPPDVTAGTRMLVVMHGTLRNAADYLTAWTAWAERTGHVVIAPHFDRTSWPGSRSYNIGNVFTCSDGTGEIRPEREWSFTKVEAITTLVADRLGLADRSIALWGHSAGAQFVHRFLLFKPRVRVRAAVAAGAGWYTVPDPGMWFPYGLAHPRLRFSKNDVRAFLRAPLTIMRGALDTLTDADLRRTPEARSQGLHRFDRAGHMFGRAHQLDPDCRWRLANVPGVGHDWTAMAAATQASWYGAENEGREVRLRG